MFFFLAPRESSSSLVEVLLPEQTAGDRALVLHGGKPTLPLLYILSLLENRGQLQVIHRTP